MGDVYWYFRVFGNPVDGSTSSENTTEKAETTSSATSTTTTPTPEPTTTSSTVKPFRVRLSYNDSSSKITSNKNYKITGSAGNILFTMASGNEASVTKVGNNIHVQVGNISKGDDIIRFIPDEGGIMEIKSWEHQPAWNQSLNDNRFRGIIEVRVVNDKTAYINELPLEDYLKGLGEVSNNALFEKQKVIAVLARTYARFYMQDENRKFPGLPYDGNDDPAVFQKYLGYGLEIRSPNYVGAVAITKDEVVTYNSELVKTPYFNQSDGATKSAEEVWGWTHTPYLKSVADPWCDGLTRNGHGVGLSGYGATKQAEEGKTYDDIIKYYYQGVEVEELSFE
jgi:peptidoglycan hydrolase-like amidase